MNNICDSSLLLDLSTAFHRVDHSILLETLCTAGLVSLGLFLYGSSLDLPTFVRMAECTSKSYKITCRVPQGSIVGPILFNTFLTSNGQG